jgi:DNA-binding PadR family transcriptional regulator
MHDAISKDLTAASAAPLVLSILEKEDSYGYAIIKRVRELSGGAMEWTEGMLYPVLHRLEEQGAVSSYWQGAEGERRRKYYRISEGGKALMATLMEQWRLVEATLRRSMKKGDGDV